jgi:hypothetical protein
MISSLSPGLTGLIRDGRRAAIPDAVGMEPAPKRKPRVIDYLGRVTAVARADRVGPYEIAAELGAGGMGEVYKSPRYEPWPHGRYEDAFRAAISGTDPRGTGSKPVHPSWSIGKL